MTTKQRKAPDWFGCGRVITTASWAGFIQAHREYWAKYDARVMELEAEGLTRSDAQAVVDAEEQTRKGNL